MNEDTRRQARQHLQNVRFSQMKVLVKLALCATVSSATALLPAHPGLEPGGRWALFILVLCAAMWVTEAIPAFATSLVAIGLMIAILGQPGGAFAESPTDWEIFIRPWGSPLIWLFFGGFCLAAGAQRTGLDWWMSLCALSWFGAKPAMVLLGVMLTTAVLSMFMSNTATATLMLAALAPALAARPLEDRLSRGLLLGIAFAGNIGGMGTIIGTPPNAIAAGVLARAGAPIDFARWMLVATPPALVLLAVAWTYLVLRYFGRDAFTPMNDFAPVVKAAPAGVPPMRQILVIATFAITILLWMTSPLTGVPTTVVSFVPICTLTATGILSSDDMRSLPWDILLLITGGLALGVAIDETGLAAWVVAQIPTAGFVAWALVLTFGYVTLILSNLMSNTAAANLVLPLAVAFFAADDVQVVIPIALCASLAMCLPISTPPNAIVYGSRRLSSFDLLAGGFIVAIVGPVFVTSWCLFVLKWI